jgi:polyisoprenoid-binding protein YceI
MTSNLQEENNRMISFKQCVYGGLTSLLFASQLIAGAIDVDSKASSIQWKGSKITGAEHHGTIGVKQGQITMDGKKLVSGKIVVDMNSVANLDLTDKEYNQKLVTHLKSEDFFDVAKFPEADIEFKNADIQKDGSYKIKGQMKIKSETHPVEFIAKLSADGKSAETDLTFDRTTWNIRYGSGKFFKNLGDKVISDKINLKINLVLSAAAKTR